jgi:hypothetical protein
LKCSLNMSPDGPDSATVLPLSRRVLSIPRTSLGKWSVRLLAAFVVLFSLFIGVGITADAARIPFSNPFRVWSILVTLISTVVLAVAAGVVALVAIFRRAERSILMLLPLLVAAFVLFWTIGEMNEGTNPCKEVKGPCVITTATNRRKSLPVTLRVRSRTRSRTHRIPRDSGKS